MKIILEHKTLNDEIRSAQTASDLHPMFHDQVQQQLYVSEADKCLFMATKWEKTNEVTDNFIDEMIDGALVRSYYNLVEKKEFWIFPDIDHQNRIISGWDQFEKDLEIFEPEPEVIKAQPTLVDDLLLPSIVVTGQIYVESNLELFGEVLHNFIGRVNVKPETDEDFVNIGKAIKSLEKAEEWLDKQEEGVISKFDQLNQTIALKNTLKELARENRLMLQKIDKAEKENRKAQIVGAAKIAMTEHCTRLQAELPITFTVTHPNFADAIKGKKTISSMQDAVSTMLANAKIESDALARELREKHTWYIENAGEYSFLFSDLQTLIYKDFDLFKAVVQNRVLAHKEQEKAKAEAEAKARAEREERIRKEAEEKVRREVQESENQAELEHAAAKANEKKTNTEVAENPPIEQKPVSNTEIQGESKANETIPTPSRESLILTIAGCYEVDFQTAEQWLLTEFSTSVS